MRGLLLFQKERWWALFPCGHAIVSVVVTPVMVGK